MGERSQYDRVIREGTVRGQGRYLDGRDASGPIWTTLRYNAWRYLRADWSKQVADEVGGRLVKVKFITLSEQLRRAKRGLEHWKQVDAARLANEYARGRVDERAVVVAHLSRGSKPGSPWANAAQAIVCGEHVKAEERRIVAEVRNA